LRLYNGVLNAIVVNVKITVLGQMNAQLAHARLSACESLLIIISSRRMPEIIEHLTHATLSEALRVLESGGRSIGTVPADEICWPIKSCARIAVKPPINGATFRLSNGAH
jgi:hypothetical protein